MTETSLRRAVPTLFLVLVLAACGRPAAHNALGMVEDPSTGLAFGSVIEKNLLVDSSFYDITKMKVRVRNSSGDPAFDLRAFRGDIERTMAAKGYEPTQDDDFRLLLDVNVRYSGQVSTDLANEFGFLGATAGGIAGGTRSNHRVAGAVGGTVAGATLGAVAGSFLTEDTYIIIADVTFGEVDPITASKKKITFSRSIQLKDVDDAEEEKLRNRTRRIRRSATSGVSVYAGGRNTPQSEISREVRERIVRIVGDFI